MAPTGILPRFHVDAHFTVELMVGGQVLGSFQELSGLGIKVRTKQVREGGVNNAVTVLPDGVEYDNITLKRGITDVGSLLDWVTACQTLGVTVNAQIVTVRLHDNAGLPLAQWIFEGAWPVRWSGPSLNAGSNTVATESLEIAFSTMSSLPIPPAVPPPPAALPPPPDLPRRQN